MAFGAFFSDLWFCRPNILYLVVLLKAHEFSFHFFLNLLLFINYSLFILGAHADRLA